MSSQEKEISQITDKLGEVSLDPKCCGGFIVFTSDIQKVLLVDNRKILCFPKGKMHIGESFRETSVRELKEETNIDVGQLRILDVYLQEYTNASSGGKVQIRYYLSFVEDEEKIDLKILDKEEIESIKFYKVEDAMKLEDRLLSEARKKLLQSAVNLFFSPGLENKYYSGDQFLKRNDPVVEEKSPEGYLRVTKPEPVCIFKIDSKLWAEIEKKKQTISRVHNPYITFYSKIIKEDLKTFRGKTYVFISMENAMKDGMIFFRSNNDKIMTDGFSGKIPRKYILDILYTD